MSNILIKNDKELLDLIKQNDADALKKLYKKYFLRLCSFAISYVKSVDLSEEVVSDVFLNIWLNRNTIKIRTNLKAYMFTSVRNRSINYLIKEKRDWEDIEIIDIEGSIIPSCTPHEMLSYKELESAIDSIIGKLPPKRQIIFRMNRIDGLKYREIAEVLSISVNTVQNHMVKAVKFISNHYPQIKSLFTTFLLFVLF